MLQASSQSMILCIPPVLKWWGRVEFLLLSHLFVLILRAGCPDLYLRSELNGLLAGRILLHWVTELQSPVTGNFVPYVDISCLCLETILCLKLISISALRRCFMKICHKVITFLLLTSSLMFLLSMRVCILNRFSRVRLFATLWTVVLQALLSMRFSRQEYWSGLPCLPPGDVPRPGIKPASPTSPAVADGFFTTVATW